MKNQEKWSPVLLGGLVLAIGVLNLVSAVSPALPERIKILKEFLPLVLIHGSRHLVVLAGFLLIVLARGIVRRKRAAWWATFFLVIASAILHLLKGLDFEEALAAALVIGLMLCFYRVFRVRSDVPTVFNAFRFLLTVVALNLAYGVFGFYMLQHHWFPHLSVYTYLWETFSVMFGTGLTVELLTRHSRWFLNSLWMIWEVGLFMFLIMLLRPVIYRRGAWMHERERAREIAEVYGGSSLVYFTLWDDKLYFFNDTMTSYLAYRQVGGVAVALGDPVGPDEELEGIIQAFVEFCDTNGWYPAFYQVMPYHLGIYRKHRLRSLHIGDEAVVNLGEFNLKGKRFKHLRNNLSRFERAGFRNVWYEPPIPEHVLSRLKEVSDDWLKYQGGEEKAFSLGWFDIGYLRETPVMTVEDQEGTIYAFANYIPMYGLAHQASPDLMRYTHLAPAGIMDYLFATSMLYLKEQGFTEFNLGLAPLAHTGGEETSSVAERTMRILYKNFYNFKGLYQFKAKFGPEWEPRYLIYPNLAALPVIALAIIRAGNPTGYAKFARWWVNRVKSRIG